MCCEQRLKELRRLGVKQVYSFGSVIIEKGLRVVGKGHAAVVVLIRHETAGVAGLKVRRADSKRDSLEGEAVLMKIAEKTGFVPRVYAYSRNLIVRDFIDGFTLEELASLATPPSLRKAFVKLINAAFELDRIGIDIIEMSRPNRQVVFMCGDAEKPYFIDLETARLSPSPSNVSRIISAIVKGYAKMRTSTAEQKKEDVHKLISLAREYKRSIDETARRNIVIQIINTILHMELPDIDF
jgi:putative serine/threonine protein kinase